LCTSRPGCALAPIICDLARSESKTFVFPGIANTAGSFHFELTLRELVHPFDYVNDRADGADTHGWDETVT